MNSSKNIFIISAVYPPEPQVSARMSWDLANYLSSNSVLVTVLCPQPSRPLNAVYQQYRNSNESAITMEGKIKVVRLPSFTAPQARFFPRILESFSFGWEITKYLAAEMEKPDVIYMNSWPLIAQALIVRYANKIGVPVVLQVMDIYPEALINKLPVFLRSIIYAPLKHLDSWIANKSSVIAVISENMRRIYIESRRIPAERIVTVPTWQDDSLFDYVPDRIDVCYHYGIPSNLFTFLYLGNIGPVAGVDFLIRAFHAAEINEAQLVIVGDGSTKVDCIKLVEHLNAVKIHFVSDPDSSNVAQLQSMAHICLLPMKIGTGMSSIPSKLTAYLFSAKPILATVDPESDTARLLKEADCGWIGDSEDLIWMVSKMREVASMRNEELSAFGAKGKEFGRCHYSRKQGVKRLAGIVYSSAIHNAYISSS